MVSVCSFVPILAFWLWHCRLVKAQREVLAGETDFGGSASSVWPDLGCLRASLDCCVFRSSSDEWDYGYVLYASVRVCYASTSSSVRHGLYQGMRQTTARLFRIVFSVLGRACERRLLHAICAIVRFFMLHQSICQAITWCIDEAYDFSRYYFVSCSTIPLFRSSCSISSILYFLLFYNTISEQNRLEIDHQLIQNLLFKINQN